MGFSERTQSCLTPQGNRAASIRSAPTRGRGAPPPCAPARREDSMEEVPSEPLGLAKSLQVPLHTDEARAIRGALHSPRAPEGASVRGDPGGLLRSRVVDSGGAGQTAHAADVGRGTRRGRDHRPQGCDRPYQPGAPGDGVTSPLAHAPLLGTLVSEPREGALMEDRDSELQVAQKRSLVCGGCGYGILRAAPPDRCPMC